MAFDILPTLQALNSHLARTGGVASTEIGEPKQPYDDNRFHASVFMRGAKVVSTVLDSTVELHSVTVRIYRDAFAEPTDEVETVLAELVSKIGDNLLGDFTLGGTIRNLDVGGEFGDAFGAEWGRVDLGQTVYRVADINIDCVVNGRTTMAT